jgi:hypothetical protein
MTSESLTARVDGNGKFQVLGYKIGAKSAATPMIKSRSPTSPTKENAILFNHLFTKYPLIVRFSKERKYEG